MVNLIPVFLRLMLTSLLSRKVLWVVSLVPLLGLLAVSSV